MGSQQFMSGEKLPDAELDDVNERLAAGLETCRSIVANYKSLIAGEAAPSDELSAPAGSSGPDRAPSAETELPNQ